MHRLHKRALYFSTLVCAVVLLVATAQAGTYSLTCGEPSFPGNVTLSFRSSAIYSVTVSVPGTATASEKCQAISSAFSGPFPTVVSGNTLTFAPNAGSGLIVDADTTGEGNTLSVSLDPGQKVQIVEMPVIDPMSDCTMTNHLMCMPAAGMTFSCAVFGSSISTGGATCFAQADGKMTNATLLAMENHQIAHGIGIPDFCTDLSQGMCMSAPFDPPNVQIFWDGHFGLDLANFGLQIVEPQTTVPEPGSALLLGSALAALWARKRRS